MEKENMFASSPPSSSSSPTLPTCTVPSQIDSNIINSECTTASTISATTPPPKPCARRVVPTASPGSELRKPITPDRLKVPKAFKYPERYRSPTDMMVSPVTKGILARSRKGGAILPPSNNTTDQLKMQDFRVPDVGLLP